MTTYTIIVNPISGRGAGQLAVPEIQRLFGKDGQNYSLVLTEKPWHATELAFEAAMHGSDVVVAVGGDGTANEVINGLMAARNSGHKLPVLGVLGVGRGNDFAYGMQVPSGLEEGYQVILGGYRRKIDIGRVWGGLYPQGRYFGNGVGIGFDAVVGFEALKMTRLHGFVSYLAAALKTIFLYYHAPLVRIELDEVTLTQPSLMVSIMNGQRMGGGFMMAPGALPEDGVFDVCIAGQVSRWRIVPLILRFMKGSQDGHSAIKAYQTKKITVTALEGNLPAHADGETLCVEGNQLSMEIHTDAMEIFAHPPGVRG